MKTELVTNLKRQATKILSELHETKEAVMITEHGKPSAYLLDVDDYEMLQRRLNLLETIARGEQAVVDGRIKNHEDAREQMAKWLK